MATLKTCFKCGAEKSISDFYKHPYMGDGHLGKCKECTKIDVWKDRQKKLQEKREYDRERASLPHRKELRSRTTKEWQMAFPDRRAAQSALRRAVLTGAVKKLPCWVCGEEAEAHHPDYSSPLDVVWLCPAHHKQAHAIATITWSQEKSA